MLVEVDKDTYEAIEEQYNGGTHKEFNDNWEMCYYVEDTLLDLFESKCLIICEQ